MRPSINMRHQDFNIIFQPPKDATSGFDGTLVSSSRDLLHTYIYIYQLYRHSTIQLYRLIPAQLYRLIPAQLYRRTLPSLSTKQVRSCRDYKMASGYFLSHFMDFAV